MEPGWDSLYMFVIRNTTVISTLLPSWHCYVLQDPFFLKARSRGKGTKEEPNIVDAMDSYRMVGCVCNEEDTNIKWFWIFEGKPKRCECGYWYKLNVHEPVDQFKLPV